MKKKGFTLVELLAVIVILAIIAIIATPIILGVIDNARKGAFKSSVYGVLDAADYYLMNNPGAIPKEGCTDINITNLNIKNADDLIGKVTVCSDGKVSANNITNGKYHASGTKKDLIITDDTTQLPGYIPNAPTITASDGKGTWHTEAYTLTITGEEGFEVYYGTTEEATTKGNKITTGVGIDSKGTETYYAKVCNDAGTCSDVTRYVARLETCEVSASITGNETDESNYSSSDVTLTANGNADCNSGIKSYQWYKDGNEIGTDSTYIATETGTYGVAVTYNSGQISPTYVTKVNIDKELPQISNVATTNTESTINLEIAASDNLGEIKSYILKYRRKMGGTWKTLEETSSNKFSITQLDSGTIYMFEVIVKDLAGNTATKTLEVTTYAALENCKIVSQVDKTKFTYGDEYSCDPGDGTYRTFYVLEDGDGIYDDVTTDIGEVSLIMQGNLGMSPWISAEDYKEAKPDSTCWWYTDYGYACADAGPITALKYLKQQTTDKGWTVDVSLPTAYQIANITGNYDWEHYNNNIFVIGTAKWILEGYDSDYYYWTSTPLGSGNGTDVWFVDYGTYDDIHTAILNQTTPDNELPVRPVITLSK